MERKGGLGITLTEMIESSNRSDERVRTGKVTRSELFSESTPLEDFGSIIMLILLKRRLSIQDVADKTGITREDLTNIRRGSLPQADVLPKIGKLEEVLGYQKGELLDAYNEIVGH